MFTKKITPLLLCVAMTAAGCAQKAADVQANYVSPNTYASYSCQQVNAEAQRVAARAGQLTGQQNKAANDDAVATGVALVLFWPAVFFIGGDKETTAELSRIKGKLEALEQVNIQKNCGIAFRRA